MQKSYKDRVAPHLRAAGFDQETVDALIDLDLDQFNYMRRVMKGEVPQALLEELGVGLETSQFHALMAILRIRSGFGRSGPQDPTVGLLAEEMFLDPSRASRIATDLVERGLVLRAASQEDGRRSILVPTETAETLVGAFMAAKWKRTASLFADWSAEEIQTFSRLFQRFSEGMRQQYPSRNAPAAED